MQEFRLSSMEERNYGIDLLRIVSMMMVVLLHVLGREEYWMDRIR